jgi:hypothetical protein
MRSRFIARMTASPASARLRRRHRWLEQLRQE